MFLPLATDSLFQLIFYVVALAFIIHSLIVSYHWLSFGADRKLSWLSVAVYLSGGALILMSLAITLNYL